MVNWTGTILGAVIGFIVWIFGGQLIGTLFNMIGVDLIGLAVLGPWMFLGWIFIILFAYLGNKYS